MPEIYDKQTGLFIANTDVKPFSGKIPSLSEIESALKPMILSASGWRKIFSEDGDEESLCETISYSDKIIAAAMAYVFAEYIKDKSGKSEPTVSLAMDSRHTGPAIADVMSRVFTSLNIQVQNLFICAAPEVMSWAGNSGETDGFAYISASHNPIGHNGVKFGLKSGGVLDGKEAGYLIKEFKEILSTEDNIRLLAELTDTAEPDKLNDICNAVSIWKKKSYDNYIVFTKAVLSGTDNREQQQKILDRISTAAEKSPVGIIAELNGSARTLTIDKEFLQSLNIKIKTVNDKPREITHRIVPEGFSLDLCREELERAYEKDSAYQLGYVPDCDGDRGNLVYINENDKAEILQAQEVFALSVLAELAYLNWTGKSKGKIAVAVNGPTSMRIETIAKAFDAEVYRAEVGEANVVNLAGNLRKDGYTVRILGEGSNGGNITYPAAVRDPLNTAGAILKLISMRSENNTPGLFEIWCKKSNQTSLYKENYKLADIIKTLPAFTSTSAFEENAIMRIRSESQAELKANYEKNFPAQWDAKREKLKSILQIESWIEINNESTESKIGIGPTFRSGLEKGGLKILFRDKDENDIAYIWMRGSGTEPVFRVLADLKGDNREAEQYLLNWQRDMISQADIQ